MVRKKGADPYPPNTLYQLICGLQHYLHDHGRADIELLENPSLHVSYSNGWRNEALKYYWKLH